MKRFTLLLVLSALWLTMRTPSAQAQAQYSLTDLGTLGGTSSYSTSLNSAGQVVGWSDTADGGQRAFLWTPGGTDGIPDNPQMKQLGILGTFDGFPTGFSQANGINDAGQVVGMSSIDATDAAFLWTPGGTDGVFDNPQMKSLGTLNGWSSSANGINASEQVVGWSYTAEDVSHAFLWIRGATDGIPENPEMKDLGTLGGASSTAAAINNAGQIVGYSDTTDGGKRAFLWIRGATDGIPDNPQMKDLGSLGGTRSYAFSINNAGQVVGYSTLPGDTIFHAFLWTPGGTDGIPDNPQMKDLGGLGGSLSGALGINSAGAITGASGDSAFTAFVWTPDVPNGATGTVTASGLTLGGSQATAFGINDSGTITGSSNLTGDPTYSGGYPVQHAFIAKLDLPNRAPIAAPQTVPTDEDAPVAITLSATDPDGNPIASYQIVDPPTHGTLLGTAPNLYYIPDRDYNGQDSFTFQASDGTIYGNTATVTINITPVNDAPVAFGIAYYTNEDSPIALGLPAADAEGDALTYSIVSGPTHGTLSGSGNSPLYTPDPNFHGADSFTFKANDGTADSNTATISIDVLSVNDPPVAVNDSATTKKNTAVTINVVSNDSDVDGDTLTVQSVTQPANGTAVKNADGAVTFTPKKGFTGTANFTYTVSDGHGGTATATVTVTVTR